MMQRRKSELPLHKAPETDRRILQSSVTQNKLAARHGVHDHTPMAAIANAIDRAVGTRLTELPMSPPKVRAAIDARAQK
jgi:hypothetical protein